MLRENIENAPRGTWNDDSTSSFDPKSRRSVSGPYRDATEAMREKRAELAKEIDGIDQQLRERAHLAREIATLDRQLSAMSRSSQLAFAARWLTRGGMALVVVLSAMNLFITYAPRHTQVIAHMAPGIVRLDDGRFVVARSMIDRLIANDAAEVRLDPVVEKNVIVGLRVAAVSDGETRELGLRTGDVIVGVDDYEIARPDGARAAYELVRTAMRFVLVVRRGGDLRRFAYEVVG